jgi:anti-sigma factor RsiW
MRCDEARDLIGPSIDGEASERNVEALRAHASACADCGQALDDSRRMSLELKCAGRVVPPAGLEPRIRAALLAEAATDGIFAARLRTLLPQATALAAACLLSVALTWTALRPSGNELRLEQDVVSAHIRSLLQDSPIQVASSDPHSVRPWFNGRVEFAPAVKDLAAEGFPLAGARLDYVGGRRVGALVYMRRLHVVNVFVWPSPGSETAEQRLVQVNGYNLISWNRGGLAYWAASDLNAGELRQLPNLL